MRIAMLVLNDMTADARVDREAAALGAVGHEVTVFCLRSAGSSEAESRDGYQVRRVADYSTRPWRDPIGKWRELRARTRAFAQAAIALRPEIVHAHDSDTLAAGVMAARRTHAALVYDAHELYPDMLREHGLRGSMPVQAYWKGLEQRLVSQADAVVTVSEGLAGELRSRYEVEPVVVANVPALTPITHTRRLRAEIGVGEATHVVLYQGVLIPGRGLDRLVRAMARVPDAVLAIQGFGAEESRLREVAIGAGLEGRVVFMGRKAPGELHEYACDADLGVVIYDRTTLNNYLAAPNKLYTYMMAGLPMVASDFPGLREVVVGEGVGTVFDPASEASIAAALNALLADSEARARMAARARELAETRYNWDLEKAKLLQVYERLAAASTW